MDGAKLGSAHQYLDRRTSGVAANRSMSGSARRPAAKSTNKRPQLEMAIDEFGTGNVPLPAECGRRTGAMIDGIAIDDTCQGDRVNGLDRWPPATVVGQSPRPWPCTWPRLLG